MRVGVETEDRLAVGQVLGHVGHEPVLPDDANHIIGLEREVAKLVASDSDLAPVIRNGGRDLSAGTEPRLRHPPQAFIARLLAARTHVERGVVGGAAAGREDPFGHVAPFDYRGATYGDLVHGPTTSRWSTAPATASATRA